MGGKIHWPVLLCMDKFLNLCNFDLIVPFIFWDQLYEICVRLFYLVARLLCRIFSLFCVVDVCMIKS